MLAVSVWFRYSTCCSVASTRQQAESNYPGAPCFPCSQPHSMYFHPHIIHPEHAAALQQLQSINMHAMPHSITGARVHRLPCLPAGLRCIMLLCCHASCCCQPSSSWRLWCMRSLRRQWLRGTMLLCCALCFCTNPWPFLTRASAGVTLKSAVATVCGMPFKKWFGCLYLCRPADSRWFAGSVDTPLNYRPPTVLHRSATCYTYCTPLFHTVPGPYCPLQVH